MIGVVYSGEHFARKAAIAKSTSSPQVRNPRCCDSGVADPTSVIVPAAYDPTGTFQVESVLLAAGASRIQYVVFADSKTGIAGTSFSRKFEVDSNCGNPLTLHDAKVEPGKPSLLLVRLMVTASDHPSTEPRARSIWSTTASETQTRPQCQKDHLGKRSPRCHWRSNRITLHQPGNQEHPRRCIAVANRFTLAFCGKHIRTQPRRRPQRYR